MGQTGNLATDFSRETTRTMDHDPKLEFAVRVVLGVPILLVGAFLVALALGFQPSTEGELQVPAWIAALAGVMMAGGGLAVLFPNKRTLGWAMAMLILAGGGTFALWVGLVSDPEKIGGGLPFIPREINQRIGQIGYTLSGLFCIALLVYGLWLGPNNRRGKGSQADR